MLSLRQKSEAKIKTVDLRTTHLVNFAIIDLILFHNMDAFTVVNVFWQLDYQLNLDFSSL